MKSRLPRSIWIIYSFRYEWKERDREREEKKIRLTDESWETLFRTKNARSLKRNFAIKLTI